MNVPNDDGRDFVFVALADTHFGYQQATPDRQDLRHGIIEQINALAGRPYPECIGGLVSRPEFVIHCGDIVDGVKSPDVELDHYDRFMSLLSFPCWEVLGNHDVSPEFLARFDKKHGGRSYSFDHKGIHFIALNTVYNAKEKGRVAAQDLEYLQRDLDTHTTGPVILCVHSRLDRLENGQDALDILKGKPVLLILSAHIHKPSVFKLEGFDCIDLGHCRNHPIDLEAGRSFYVVRMTAHSLTAVPWRWDYNDWERGQRWEHRAADRMKSLILQATFQMKK